MEHQPQHPHRLPSSVWVVYKIYQSHFGYRHKLTSSGKRKRVIRVRLTDFFPQVLIIDNYFNDSYRKRYQRSTIAVLNELSIIKT